MELSPREGGYAFLTSPDLPGFSIMLRPKDQESIEATRAAVTKPLEAFILAECNAVENHKHKKTVKIGLSHGKGSNLVAELCPS